MAKRLSGKLQCPKSARLPVLKSLNYKGAREQAGTLFELTPAKFHFETTNQITGGKKLILSNAQWQRLTDAAKEEIKEGLGDIMLVLEVMESGDSGGYYESSQLYSKQSESLVLPRVLFEYKGSRAPRPVVWPKDYQVNCSAQRQLDFLFSNY